MQNVNEAPTVATPIADQKATEDTSFTFVMPANTLPIKIWHGGTLTYSATLETGAALPSWLSFEASTGTFRAGRRSIAMSGS